MDEGMIKKKRYSVKNGDWGGWCVIGNLKVVIGFGMIFFL